LSTNFPTQVRVVAGRQKFRTASKRASSVLPMFTKRSDQGKGKLRTRFCIGIVPLSQQRKLKAHPRYFPTLGAVSLWLFACRCFERNSGIVNENRLDRLLKFRVARDASPVADSTFFFACRNALRSFSRAFAPFRAVRLVSHCLAKICLEDLGYSRLIAAGYRGSHHPPRGWVKKESLL